MEPDQEPRNKNDGLLVPGDAGGETQDSSRIEEQLKIFAKSTDSLMATFPLTMWIVSAAHRGASNEMREFIRKKCANVEVDAGEIRAEVPPLLSKEHSIIDRKLNRSSIASKIIARSFVVSLVSQYDSFLGGLIKSLFYLRPELVNASDRALSFKELSEFQSIEAARGFVVEKEVEALIRRSHSEQFDWMEKKFQVELRKGLGAWPKFIELTERRNLFVHCDSKVSSQYLAVCRQNGLDCQGLAVGDDLNVTRPYLIGAYECVFEIGVKLAHVLWRKLAPQQREEADQNLNLICIDLLSEGHYRLARELLNFAVHVLKTWSSDANRRIFLLNLAQAEKWLGDDTSCRKILDEEDWSAVEEKFSLAVAVLEGRYNDAIRWMKRIGKEGVKAESYREWPIFRELRKRPEFFAAYKEIFEEDFSALPEDTHISFNLELESNIAHKTEIAASQSAAKS